MIGCALSIEMRIIFYASLIGLFMRLLMSCIKEKTLIGGSHGMSSSCRYCCPQ